MFKFLAFLLIFTSFHCFSCRVPYHAPSGLIEFEYLDEPGQYAVRTPAVIGEGELVDIKMVYKKECHSSFVDEKLSFEIDGKVMEENWIGTFSAPGREGYEAWIIATWDTQTCSTRSEKKVKLFSSNTK